MYFIKIKSIGYIMIQKKIRNFVVLAMMKLNKISKIHEKSSKAKRNQQKIKDKKGNYD